LVDRHRHGRLRHLDPVDRPRSGKLGSGGNIGGRDDGNNRRPPRGVDIDLVQRLARRLIDAGCPDNIVDGERSDGRFGSRFRRWLRWLRGFATSARRHQREAGEKYRSQQPPVPHVRIRPPVGSRMTPPATRRDCTCTGQRSCGNEHGAHRVHNDKEPFMSSSEQNRKPTRTFDTPLQPRPRGAGSARSRTGSTGSGDQQLLTWTDEDRRLAAEFTHSDPWRVQRITSEFVAGFDALAETGPAVSIFGSARVPEGDALYEDARRLGSMLASAGVTV